MRPAAFLALALFPARALAGRPDDGVGLFHYDDTDVLAFVDGPAGAVRVHYSVDGPNATLLRDDDASGFPDFAEDVAVSAEEVLSLYAETGFRPPLSEADVGLGDLGGSGAFDFYLLDFGGAGDGNFSVDACSGGVCAGHMIMENDFTGYGYPSLAAAIRVLTSHELFHGVQNAYVQELPVWLSEGTAVWAEKLFDENSSDFRSFANAYLGDTGRSLDRPPAGPVPAFAYGTCLFWEFLSQSHGDSVIVDLLEAAADVEAMDAIDEAIVGAGSTLHDDWDAFTVANLATGTHAGLSDFYPFADRVDEIAATATGTAIQDDERFYPLAASYYFVSHPGGEMFFASLDDPTGLVLSLHPVPGGGESSPVDAAVATWAPESGEATAVGDFAAGDYWLRGTYPEPGTESVHVEFCLGVESAVAPCVPAPQPDAGAVDDAGTPDAGAPDAGDDAPTTEDGGCSCSTSGGRSSPFVFLALAAFVFATRRQRIALDAKRARRARVVDGFPLVRSIAPPSGDRRTSTPRR